MISVVGSGFLETFFTVKTFYKVVGVEDWPFSTDWYRVEMNNTEKNRK